MERLHVAFEVVPNVVLVTFGPKATPSDSAPCSARLTADSVSLAPTDGNACVLSIGVEPVALLRPGPFRQRSGGPFVVGTDDESFGPVAGRHQGDNTKIRT